MSLYSVQKLFYHLSGDPKAKTRFETNPEEMLSEYRLSPEEAQAIRSVDLTKLYRLGVHPLLLRHFSIVKGIGMPDYLKAISKVEEEKL